MKEYEFYEKEANWDFSMIKSEKEDLTNWDMYKILKNNSRKNSIILDLGTGGGENVIKNFPKAKKIIAADFSPAMIETANQNLVNSGRTDIEFRVMNNLKMDTIEDGYFDIVVARHTVTDPKQIYRVLKPGGLLIIRGVDMMDCWELKKMCGKGQGYQDAKPISFMDYNAVLDAGFKEVELVPLHTREYFKTKEDLLRLLFKTPIIDDFSEENLNNNKECKNIDLDIIDKYIDSHIYKKGILLIRRYYGIVAKK